MPPDWGYVHNFEDPDRPCVLELPPGGGVKLRDEVDVLLAQAAEAMEASFSGDQYAESRHAIGRDLEQKRAAQLGELEEVVRKQGFALVQTPGGVILAPVVNDQPITQEQFAELPAKDRESFAERGQALQENMERTLRHVHELEEAAQERLRQLDAEIAAAAVRPICERLIGQYTDWPSVTAHLRRVQAHIADDVEALKAQLAARHEQKPPEQAPGPGWFRPNHNTPYDRYRINVIVDNRGLSGAPVIVETNPTYANLIGRVGLRAEFGTMVTDYREIKAGALHRANGGYLLLDARVLLRQPWAWEVLKQALRNLRVRIEDPEHATGPFAMTSLMPEPTPLDVKVVLIGDPETYYALHSLDEQFEKLFKVHADFAVEMDWTAENEAQIVQFIHHLCNEESLPHFDQAAVAQVVEYSGRLVEDQRKLTTRFAHVSDIVVEAAYWAREAGRETVAGADVARAID